MTRRAGGLIQDGLSQKKIWWGIVTASYLIAVYFGLKLEDFFGGISIVWPASGVALALLILTERSKRRIVLGIIFATGIAAYSLDKHTPATSLFYSLADTIRAAIGIWVLTRFCGEQITFTRTRETVVLFGVVTVVVGSTDLIEAWVTSAASATPFLLSWYSWWAADGIGILLLTPFTIAWALNPYNVQAISLQRIVEGLALLIALLVISRAIFGAQALTNNVYVFSYLFFPILIWSGLRFSPRGSTSILLVLSALTVWLTSQGYQVENGLGGFSQMDILYREGLLAASAISTLILTTMVTELKVGQLALREAAKNLSTSDARYRALFEQSHDAVFILGLSGNCIMTNQRAAELLDYTIEELQRLSIREISAEQQKTDEVTRRLLAGDHVPIHERLFRKKSGEIIPVEISLELVRDSEGRPLHIQGVVRDISERKRAESALGESEKRYRLIFNGVQDAIFVESTDGKILAVNDRACEMYGYSRDEFLAKTVADIVPKDKPIWPLSHASTSSLPLETVNIRSNGEQFPIEISGREQIINGEAVRLVIVRDITERKRTEEALRESEEEYRGLFENMAEGFAYCRMIFEEGIPRDWIYLKVNNAFEVLTGLKEITGKRVTEAIPGILETNPQLFEIYGRVSLTGQAEQFETYVEALKMWFSISVYSPRREFFVAVFTVITERKRAEQELRRHAEKLNTLQETLLEITSRHSLPEVLNSIVERAVDLLHSSGGGLYLTEPGQRRVRCVVSYRTKRNYTGTILDFGEGAAGHVAATGKSLIINDYSIWSGRAPTFADDSPFYAVMSAPLLWQGQVTGVIHVLREQGVEGFSEDELELLELLANHAAVAVENARLFEETRERLLELETLHTVSASLRTAETLEAALPIIMDETLKALETDSGMIMLYDPITNSLHDAVKRGWFVELSQDSVRPGDGIAGTVFSSGQAHISPEFALDPLAHPGMQSQIGPGLGGVCAPIRTGSETLGVIFISVALPRQISPEQIKMLNSLADMTGAALQRMKLHEETAHRVEEFSALYETSMAISGEHELSLLLETIVQQATALLKASGGGMYLYNPASNDLTMVVATEPSMPIGTRLQLGEGVAGRVSQTCKPIRIDDYSVWEHRSLKYEGTPIRATLEVPMMYGGELIGVLVAHEVGASERKFSDADERLLSLFASQAAGVIRSARLYDESAQRIRYLQTLRSIDRAITANMDSNVTLKILLNQAINHADIDAASILLFNPNTLRLEYQVGEGFRTRENQKASIRLGEDYAGVVALERRMRSLPHPSELAEGPFKEFLIQESFLSCHLVPMIAKGQVLGVLQVFSRELITAGREWFDFLEALATQAAIAIDNAQLFHDLQHANFELSIAYDATIERWSAALESRQSKDDAHTKQIIDWTVQLAREAGLEEKVIGHIRRGAILHDIGNMAVPDHILQKPSSLTRDEWEIVRRHPSFAFDMLTHVNFLRPALDIPYCHHERWDGKGYPRGLSGEQIPLAARVFAVVDVWHALTSNRPHRKAWTKQKALVHIRSQSGKQFDPRIVNLFLEFVSKMDKNVHQDY